MGAILAEILAIAADLMKAEPAVVEVVDVVEAAIAAFRANDQAGIDTANAKARALADSHKPEGV
jgi:hypothetical protein